MMKGRAESLQSIPRFMHKEINYSTLSSLSPNDYHLINQFRPLEGYIDITSYNGKAIVMGITLYDSNNYFKIEIIAILDTINMELNNDK